MGTNEMIGAIALALILGGILAYIFWKERRRSGKGIPANSGQDNAAHGFKLQLQAYERLILLTERIALPNLISRNNQPGLSVRDMQFLLINAIKQEYEHNVTQQIYVSAEAWEALRNYKDQNIHIINQVASFLPPEASGTDLNKHILEMLLQNPKVSLHNVVSEVLSFEAKKAIR